MRSFRPVLLILGLIMGGGLCAPAAAKEQWSKVESTYFTLHAECSPTDARAWAVSFAEFCRYATGILGIPPTQLQPLTIVLFKNRAELKRYYKRDPAPGGGLAGASATNDRNELGAMTVRRETGTIIATSLNWDDRDTRQLFYHLGTYWFLSGFKEPGPAWFQAGLASAFETFSVAYDTIQVGKALEGEVQFLREHQLMPLPQLFGIEFGDLNGRSDTRQRLFQAQSWALVHYLIFGRETMAGGKTRSPMLADFMEAMQRGEAAEPAFKRVFGTDYDGMIRRLDNYVTSGRYAVVTIKFDPLAVAAELKASVETDGEREIVLGYACLAGLSPAQARRHFFTAATLPGGELPAAENLGEMAMLEQNDQEARTHYARAVALGSRDFHAYYFLGDEMMRDAMRNPGTIPRFDARQAREAASRFEEAINRYPKYMPSYERLALLMPSVEKFSNDDRQFLELGLRVAPGNDLIEAGLGVWELKNNQVAEGRERLHRLLAKDHRTSGWARLMAEDVAHSQAASSGMAEARTLMNEGRTDEAGELVGKLLANAPTDSLRDGLVALQEEIGQLDLVLQAEKLADNKEWESAGAIAKGAMEADLPPPLRLRAEAVLARVAAKK